MQEDVFFLEPSPPFRLDFTAWTLRRRADNAIDRWDGVTYRRVLTAAEQLVEVAVTQEGLPESPRLRVAVMGGSLHSEVRQAVTAVLERLLGLRVDLTAFYRLASRDPDLNLMVQRFYGMKPPRFASVFEAAINAIACQQITLTLGIKLLNHLSRKYGSATAGGTSNVHAFPRPEDLASLTPGMLRDLGFSQQKGRAMLELAQHVAGGSENLEMLSSMPDNQAIARLVNLRGIGRWSAEYILLRGLGRVHIFPGDDVGARNNLQRWMKIRNSLDYASVQEALGHRQPYGGLIYFHLLLDRLAEKGLLDSDMPSNQLSAENIVHVTHRKPFPVSDAPSRTDMSSENLRRKKTKRK